MKIKDFGVLSVGSLRSMGGETSQSYACVWQHVGIPNLPFVLELLDCRHSGIIVCSAIWSTCRLCSIDSIAIAELEPHLHGLHKIF